MHQKFTRAAAVLHAQFTLVSSMVTIAAASFTLLATPPAAAQQYIALDEADGYDRYRDVQSSIWQLRNLGTVRDIRWSDDGAAVYFTRDGERIRFDLDELFEEPADEDIERDEVSQDDAPRRLRPPRAQQRTREPSPCGEWVAICRDWNVVIEPVEDNADEENCVEDGTIVVTTEGHRKHRFGSANWVYGEELRQSDAMWWSPDSRYLAYYELDERDVEDYYITDGLTEVRTNLLVEGYPKPGEPNPIAKLWVYDLETEDRIKVQTHESDEERYIYRIRFTPDGSELLFHRTNRHQNVLDLVAADVETGESRIILTEEQDTWQDNWPDYTFLNDGEHFIWESERSGFKQYELRHLDGTMIVILTERESPVRSIEHIDESADVLYYTAFCEKHPLNVHLHRVGLDGSNPQQLTHHAGTLRVDIAPDGAWFIARTEATDEPPRTTLHTIDGEQVATLAEPDLSRFEELGLNKPTPLEMTAADGETILYGVMHTPSDFDPGKSYPLVLNVYGGPLVQRMRNTWNPANAACELGMVIVSLDNRGTPNRGKAFEDAAYLKLGVVDLADQVAAVKQLIERPYLDANRVGIYGHSYGGYLAALAILKHPDIFHVAVAAGAVTDWRNYDTIYTERFMRLPEENPEGYETSSCMTYADQLEGDLLILHGMLDDNVHPSNAFQLIDALQQKGKRFDMMMFPRNAHGLGAGAANMRWEYLINRLSAGAK